MTDFRMRLIIETILKDEKLLKTLKKDLEGLEDGAKKGESGLTKFVQGFNAMKGEILAGTAIIVGFGIAAKKVFDLSLEGAQVIQLAESFDLLIRNAGVMPDLLAQLKLAAGGTVSEFELMTSVMTLVMGTTGGLKKELIEATPQLLEIAKASNKLNPSLGTTTFLFESLARGIKRSAPLILDNLGVVIKVGEAYGVYATKVGKTVKELTAIDKTQAILAAALIAGIPLIEQAGGSTTSYADTWLKLTANIIDSKNALLSWLAEGLQPVISAVDIILFGQGMIEDAFSSAKREIELNSESYDEYLHAIVAVGLAAGKLVLTQEEANNIIARSPSMVRKLNDAYIILSVEELERVRTLDAINKEQALIATGNFEFALKQIAEEEENVAKEGERAEQAAIDLAKAIEDAEKAFANAREEFSRNPFSGVERGFLGRLKGFFDDLRFIEAGGQKLVELLDTVTDRIFEERITEAQGKAIWEQITIAGFAVEVELGNLDYSEAVKQAAATLHLDPDVIDGMFENALSLEDLEHLLSNAELMVTATMFDIAENGVGASTHSKQIANEIINSIFETSSKVTGEVNSAFIIMGGRVDTVKSKFGKLGGMLDANRTKVDKLRDAINHLKSKTITVKVRVVGGGSLRQLAVLRAEHGLDFKVPQGFPNDSFPLPLAVTSGEVVSVTPKGREPSGHSNESGRGTIHVNAPIFFNSEANQTLEELVHNAIPTHNL